MSISSKDTQDILKTLPHKYPFLLVDRVQAYSKGEYITAYKNVTYNEPFFSGHFPDNPIMPGVLVIEAMAQTAGIFIYKESEYNQTYLLAGLDSVRFKDIITPGDVMYMNCILLHKKMGVWKFNCKVTVENSLKAYADITLLHTLL